MSRDPIIQRAYTISEIDRMRRAIHSITGVWTQNSAEEHLRTYMMAGISVEDLEQSARQQNDAYCEARIARAVRGD